MSHTVKIKTKFTQFDSLKKALDKLGWKIKENAKIRTYPGDSVGQKTWQYVGVNPENGYDVGLEVNKTTGEIEVYGDFYGGTIAKTLGNDLNVLKQQYAAQVIEDEYAWEGYNVNVEKLKNGDWEVTVEK